MKKLLIGLLLSFPFVVSGQGDNKLIKDAIQNNEITSIQIIADSSFHPGELLKFDIEIETKSGLKARASEKKIVSKEAGVFIEGGRQREPGEIETFEGNTFYPEKPLKITVELANATDSVKIFPSYCYKNFVI